MKSLRNVHSWFDYEEQLWDQVYPALYSKLWSVELREVFWEEIRGVIRVSLLRKD